MTKKVVSILVLFLSFKSIADTKCSFVPEGCSVNTKCYWGRLQLSCENGMNGFVNDDYKPEKIRISTFEPYGGGIKGGQFIEKEIQNPGFSLYD